MTVSCYYTASQEALQCFEMNLVCIVYIKQNTSIFSGIIIEIDIGAQADCYIPDE